jgi:hypothetical protein
MISQICLALGSFIFGYIIGRMLLVTYSIKNLHSWVYAITKNTETCDTHIKYILDIRKNLVQLEDLTQELEQHIKENIKNDHSKNY